MMSVAGADRLQSGMRNAWGKSYSKACRVDIGDYLASVRVMDGKEMDAREALRRGAMKLPGKQKIVISNKFGFTKYTKEQINEFREKNMLVEHGSQMKVFRNKGLIENSVVFNKLHA